MYQREKKKPQITIELKQQRHYQLSRKCYLCIASRPLVVFVLAPNKYGKASIATNKTKIWPLLKYAVDVQQAAGCAQWPVACPWRSFSPTPFRCSDTMEAWTKWIYRKWKKPQSREAYMEGWKCTHWKRETSSEWWIWGQSEHSAPWTASLGCRSSASLFWCSFILLWFNKV